jgi:hypothetical protein
VKLYHGTSAHIARQALTNGLLPRSESGADGNWEHTCPSNPELVYLTSAYAPYFAMTATEPGELWGIVEVDTDLLDEYDFLPDEDFLEQASREQELPEDWGINGASMEDRTQWFREHLWQFRHLWEKSIEGLGNCAHEGVIPPEAISRISLYDSTSNPSLSMMAMDPAICLMNYRFCGEKYRALCEWFMGDDVKPLRFLGIPGLDPDTPLEGPWKQMADQYITALALRDGLEIVQR